MHYEKITEQLSNLADNLRMLLSDAKISERELARRTDVPQPVIHRILNSQTLNPTLDTLKKLASYFTINVSELSGETQSDSIGAHHYEGQHLPILSQKQVTDYIATGIMPIATLHVLVDVISHPKMFAYQVTDDSMGPMLSKKDTLILDANKTALRSGSFIMIMRQDSLLVREVTTHKKEVYLQSYQPSELIQYKPDSDKIIATLIQSRKSFRV